MFKLTSLLPLILFILFGSQPSFAQPSEKQAANDLLHEAISLMQNGKPDEAIVLLKKASELDPQNAYPYQYETALAYYYKQDYHQAIRMLTQLSENPNCTSSLYQALGNAYDGAGKRRKALKAYDAGLARFPDSGDLYREKALVLFARRKATEALACAERAIQLDPMYPSNYFTAASLCHMMERPIKTLIYGELAMLLEREGVRNENTSRVLYQRYEARLDPQDSTIQPIAAAASLAKLLLHAGSEQHIPGINEMDENRIIGPLILDALVRKRGELVEEILQQQAKGEDLAARYDCPYAEPLARFLRKVRDAGHLEAYHYYLLRMGSRDGFEQWSENHAEQLYAFSAWFEGQALVIEPSE